MQKCAPLVSHPCFHVKEMGAPVKAEAGRYGVYSQPAHYPCIERHVTEP